MAKPIATIHPVSPALQEALSEGGPEAPVTPTSAQSESVRQGQRKINLIWETTQALIALGMTAAAVYAELTGVDSSLLQNGWFAVMFTYLTRTNHTRVGGVGPKEGTR